MKFKISPLVSCGDTSTITLFALLRPVSLSSDFNGLEEKERGRLR